MSTTKYEDILVEVSGEIGIIKVWISSSFFFLRLLLNALQFNRPKSLNAFGGKMVPETINAIRELNANPNTVFTVLTGEGRFFCSGTDVRGKPSLLLPRISTDHVNQVMASTAIRCTPMIQRRSWHI
jgi:peroxisomal 3,2-trans-enoyl-CoA isomerase